MAIEHVNIPDGERHEPKGISAATVGQVYVADGSSSGAWRDTLFQDTIMLADVSQPSFILLPITKNMTIISVRMVLAGSISSSDSVVSVTRGGDSASLGSQTIAHSGSAEGTTFDLTTASNNILTASTHKYLKFASDGGSTGNTPLFISVNYRITV